MLQFVYKVVRGNKSVPDCSKLTHAKAQEIAAKLNKQVRETSGKNPSSPEISREQGEIPADNCIYFVMGDG